MENADIQHLIGGAGKTQEIVNGGISQVFEYGIAMTIMALFLLASLVLNAFLLRLFVKFLKDCLKLVSDIYALAGVMQKQQEKTEDALEAVTDLLKIKKTR